MIKKYKSENTAYLQRVHKMASVINNGVLTQKNILNRKYIYYTLWPSGLTYCSSRIIWYKFILWSWQCCNELWIKKQDRGGPVSVAECKQRFWYVHLITINQRTTTAATYKILLQPRPQSEFSLSLTPKIPYGIYGYHRRYRFESSDLYSLYFKKNHLAEAKLQGQRSISNPVAVNMQNMWLIHRSSAPLPFFRHNDQPHLMLCIHFTVFDTNEAEISNADWPMLIPM